jgi:maltose alpha-D-glucosyltransferase/alpha-amylase
VGNQPYVLSLAPYGYYWFMLERQTGSEGNYGIEETLI